MRPKAIQDLAQLSDKDLFKQISIGYEQILKHALSLDDDAQMLGEQKHITSNRVLAAVAEEEAAKCLILLDAVRCPRAKLSTHLEKFNSHLAKGLYREACYLSFPEFADFENYVNGEQKKYYLDGPNEYEWILPNRLLSEREETLYIDYSELDDGRHVWLIPSTGEFWMKETPIILELVKAFYNAGCITPQSLQVIAELWRSQPISNSFTFQELQKINIQTLTELNKRDLLHEQPNKVFRIIIDCWTFPMYTLDIMKYLQDNKEELNKIRKQLLANNDNPE